MQKQLSICLFFVITSALFGQKKVIEPSDYMLWKRIENQQISNNGQFVSYEIKPLKGDGKLIIYNTETQKNDSIQKGKDAQISYNSDFVVFKIGAGYDTLRNCELKGLDKKKWPKDSLGIFLLDNDSLIKIPLIKTFELSEKSSWLCYLVDDNTLKEEATATSGKKKRDKKKKKEEKDEKKATSEGKVLTAIHPVQGITYKFKNVTDYELSADGKWLTYVTHQKLDSVNISLHLFNLSNGNNTLILEHASAIKTPVFDKNSELLSFISSADTSKEKGFCLQLFDLNTSNLKTIADSINLQGRSVSENRTLFFRNDNQYLFFGVNDYPKPTPKDTLLANEKVNLDIWHYADERLQSTQLVDLKNDLKKNHLCAYNFNLDTIIQLSNDSLEINTSKFEIGNYLLGINEKPYEYAHQWDALPKADFYRVSLETGAAELIKKAIVFDGKLSPSGQFFSYFDEKLLNYYLLDLTSSSTTCMTCPASKIEWQDENNGLPIVMDPFGVIGYSNDEKQIFIQSKYDVWNYQVETKELSCLTKQIGENNKIRLSYNKWSNDSIYCEAVNTYFTGFNEKTKGLHLYQLTNFNDREMPIERYSSDHKFYLIKKSKYSDQIIFRKMSLTDYPEIRVTSDYFQSEKIISSTNPQQANYNWASVEKVEWKDYKGKALEGLVYFPENLDRSKSYPLLIYYYELNSDELHAHYTPKPSASIIFPTEYASAGYIVFIPDIRYEVGHPAKSAYNCIMSGTDYLLKQYAFIDSTRMGLQGQSWGGYQTAQLITMTNRYKAAMAGAPVSNMFSAYGGIRWGSGVSRQFQYEMGQSRIGKTIWEAPELYIENSPLFHLPKVETPLLFMSNDNDGAVPWYQGIELYTGLKRLGKTCWMLNYNEEEHNLVGLTNKIDLSIRMRQFFDHYLQGEPAPVWMTEGIPAIKKGKELGY